MTAVWGLIGLAVVGLAGLAWAAARVWSATRDLGAELGRARRRLDAGQAGLTVELTRSRETAAEVAARAGYHRTVRPSGSKDHHAQPRPR